MSGEIRFASRSRSTPFICGIRISVIRISTRSCLSSSSPAAPSAAISTSYPSRRSTIDSSSRIERSSSTTSTRAGASAVLVPPLWTCMVIDCSEGLCPSDAPTRSLAGPLMPDSARVARFAALARVFRRFGRVWSWSVQHRRRIIRLGGRQRQRDLDTRSHAPLRRDVDLAAVVADDAVDDGEAEAGAAFKRTAKWLKDAVELFRCDADTLILDPDEHLAGRMVVLQARRHRQRQHAAVRHRANSVGRKVPDNLANLVRVGHVPNRIGWNIHGDLMSIDQLRVVLEQRRGIGHDLPDVHAAGAETLRPRICEETADRLVQPIRFAQHDVHELPLFFGERDLLSQNLD